MSYIVENYKVKNPVKTINIDESLIKKVYVGKDNCCRCGCGGTYYYQDKDKKKFHEMMTLFNRFVNTDCVREVEDDGRSENNHLWLNVAIGPAKKNFCYCFYFQD